MLPVLPIRTTNVTATFCTDMITLIL